MLFNRTKILLTCTLVSSVLISACSNADNTQKKENTLTATTPASSEESNITERNAKQRLIQTLEKHFKTANIPAKIVDAKLTEMPNIYWVKLEGMSPVYVSSDGQFLIQGDVIRLGETQLSSIGDKLQAVENKKYISELKKQDLLVYPAKSKAKHVVYIFTDASCPYCHKLHAQVPDMNNKGIEVRYIAWPRGEEFFPTMESIWCSTDRKAAFEKAMTGAQIETQQCKNPVRAQYEMGLKMGVNGTPAIYNSEGTYLGGFMTSDDLLKRLEK